MTNKTLDETKARQARELARLEGEMRIAEMIPADVPKCMIVTQAKEHWLSFTATDWSDVLQIFDAFTLAPAFDCRDRGSRGTYREERGECLGEYFAWVEMSGSVNLSPTASFRAFATLEDGSPVTLVVKFESAYWRKGPWHSDLAPQFINMKPRATKYPEYSVTGPLFLAQAAQVVSYSTGVCNGSAGHWKGYFATRECLAAAIDTLR